MSSRPNILWILTTQWRGQACGFAGDADVRTPFLDAFARTATHYREAVTPHPFGPFARAALLTGVRSPENGVGDYYDPLPINALTIAHRLRKLGYLTAYFGKWHLAARDRNAALVGEAHARTTVPEAARGGFEIWDGFEGGFLLNDPWLQGWRSAEPRQERGYQSDVVCTRAAEFVAEQRAALRPWFAVISLEPPHPPYDAPAAGVAPRDPREIRLRPNVPLGGEAEAKARRELAGYHAHIEATDRAIGRLLRTIPAETMVVFTSVHGDMHGAHGLFRKGWPHEESIRVPLVIRWPQSLGAAAPAAGESAHLVSLLDLSAWTLTCADGGVPEVGREAQAISMPSVVQLPHQCDRAWRGLRTKSRKLILNADGSPWLFFDRVADPFEQRNLVDAPEYREERDQLRALVAESVL